MKQIKVSEASNLQLNWLVSKCEGRKDIVVEHGIVGFEAFRGENWGSRYIARFSPTTDWSQGGPIIDRERIAFTDKKFLGDPQREWLANLPRSYILDSEFGPTHLVAAMRVFVASKLGQEIDIPEELI